MASHRKSSCNSRFKPIEVAPLYLALRFAPGTSPLLRHSRDIESSPLFTALGRLGRRCEQRFDHDSEDDSWICLQHPSRYRSQYRRHSDGNCGAGITAIARDARRQQRGMRFRLRLHDVARGVTPSARDAVLARVHDRAAGEPRAAARLVIDATPTNGVCDSLEDNRETRGGSNGRRLENVSRIRSALRREACAEHLGGAETVRT